MLPGPQMASLPSGSLLIPQWPEATPSLLSLPQRSRGSGVAGCYGLSGAAPPPFPRERWKVSLLHEERHWVFSPHSQAVSKGRGPLGICFFQDHLTQYPLRANSARVTKSRRSHRPRPLKHILSKGAGRAARVDRMIHSSPQ